MIANILIAAFLLIMILVWGHFGFFSALLHLGVTVLAVSLAFALWEPLVMSLGMSFTPVYAWAVWLLVPFLFWMVLLRVAQDKLVPGNAQTPYLVNILGGGACGLLAGILSSGIILIAISLLPMGITVGGYNPYSISTTGQVQENAQGGLWLPVDQWTVGLVDTLAQGTFESSTPLSLLRPDLVKRAAELRLREDLNASLVATPGAVKVTKTVVHPLPIEGFDLSAGPNAGKTGYHMLVIDTLWERDRVTFDRDTALRLEPTHVRLITWEDQGGRLVAHSWAPVGLVKVDLQDDGSYWRVYQPLDNTVPISVKSTQTQTYGWVFVVPREQQVKFLDVRLLRIPLEEPTTLDDDKFFAALGAPRGLTESQITSFIQGPDQPPATPQVGEREGMATGSLASQIEVTNRLPRPVNRSSITGAEYVGDRIISVNQTAPKLPQGAGRNATAYQFHSPPGKTLLRMELTRADAYSIYGRARASAAALNPPLLYDSLGRRYFACGYVRLHANGSQILNFNIGQSIGSARELDISSMQEGEKLYLYFPVETGATIVEYKLAQTTQKIEPPIAATAGQ